MISNMKYILINPTFVEAPIEITNRQAISEIDTAIRETLDTTIGTAFLIRIDKMFYKLILKEKNKEYFKFELTSNIYI